ncbi:MAG: putative cobyric acid synthase CobQ [Candidatus Saccharibacteria bacterium]|nr:putative cobyric acid synthase CobQ [Candidatus Saccharibacteria bacterium]
MNSNRPIKLLHLYPRDMNIYGDHGNILTLQRRLEWYGYTPVVLTYDPGDSFPDNVDIIVGGGGQDSGQSKVQDDLHTIVHHLQTLADSNVPMLMVCGLYQLFGKFFKTSDDEIIKGIGLLDIETYAKPERLIGNIIVRTKEFGDVIGYENHSGQTFIGEGATAFGSVIKGAGNNMADSSEGARYNNVIGTYLHGSILPKNPRLADFLITTAVTNRYGSFEPSGTPDDHLIEPAREIALKRPR